MHVPESLYTIMAGEQIEIIAEKTAEATITFNRLFNQGKNVGGAFHLTC
jgi:hypothetical protein